MRIQRHVYLAFEVRGKNLKPKSTNPVLHKFYNMLNDFRIERDTVNIVLNNRGERVREKGKMGIVVIDKDPANLEQKDSTWLKGSIHLNMEVIGYREGEEGILGIDHDIEVLILTELQKLKIDEGKYNKHVKIEVLEVTFTQSQKRYPHVWPSNEIPVVGF